MFDEIFCSSKIFEFFEITFFSLSQSTGCDSGFGHEIALDLNRQGFIVFAGCLYPDKQPARSLLVNAKHPESIHLIQIDVTNDLTVHLALEKVNKLLSSKKDVTLWALINNAGVCPYGEIEWGSFETIKNTLDVNTLGPIMVTRTFLPLIRQSKGRIVNINSVASRVSVPCLVPYCISKSASLAFTEGLRREMRKFSVQVVSIEPYFFKTPMTSPENIVTRLEKVWNETDDKIKREYGIRYFKRARNAVAPTVNLYLENETRYVIDSVTDAITNVRPKYHYLCANLLARIYCSLIPYCTPQETMESIFAFFETLLGRTQPLPEKPHNQ